jgi:hypothetical protein
MKLILRLAAALIILIAVYNVWVIYDIPPTDNVLTKSIVPSDGLIVIGADSGKGNLIGIQPYLRSINYANENTFKASIEPFFVAAKEKKIFNNKTIVVLPENIGSWLIAFEEKENLYKNASIVEAMRSIILANIFKFSVAYITASKLTDKKKYALFAMKAKQIAAVYERVIGGLAKEYNVTIVAGSMVLPNPSINNEGGLVVGKGILYNTSMVFNPEGKLVLPLLKTAFSIDEEFKFTPSKEDTQMYTFNSASDKHGMKVFFNGLLWDKKLDGRIVFTNKDLADELAPTGKSRMVNLWLK